MPDTPATTYPDTPAAVATAVLEAVQNRPHALNMNAWYDDPDERPLAPQDAPGCNTTLCVAGWAAHLTGWTLHTGSVWVEKDGHMELIETVAREALGLDSNGLFYTNSATAISVLRDIAAT
ncbi:hypothetical protein [Streptomyces sp. NPDC055058]